MAWAAAKHISDGVSENRFAPDLEIKREEWAALLYRYAEYMGYDISVG